ncbi:hypothetical protein ACI3ER_12025 [Bacillus sp. Wb]
MDWKLYDLNGEFIQEVNCQFDACDFAFYNGAGSVKIDFEKQEAYILSKREN